jgi:stringent starvation protein B
MDDRASDKKERLLAALERGMVMVHLDARRPGVVVPPSLRCESHLRLNLSYRFEPPDLTVGEWGLRSTLSFSGHRFAVAIPWGALFAITSHCTHEFWMFPEDMPPELTQAPVLARPPVVRPAVNGRPVALREVPAGDRTDGSEPEDGDRPRGRGHLRVVK